MWGNGSCSAVCPVFLVKSLLHFYCCPHLGPNVALLLTCKMKGNRGHWGQGNESLLIHLAQIHRAGFLLYHGYAQGRWELGLFLVLSQALGTHFLEAWKLLDSPFFRGGSKGAIQCMLYVSNILMERRCPDALSGTTGYQREVRRLHCCIHSLPHCAASKSSCILSWREILLSPNTMDRACTKAYILKVRARTSGKLSGKEIALG